MCSADVRAQARAPMTPTGAARGRESPDARRAPQQRARRIQALARLDALVHLYDPIARQSTPTFAWDSAFAARVIAIRDASTASVYRSELAALLASLGDPLTRVVRDAPRGWRGAWEVDSIFRLWPADGDGTRTHLAADVRRARGVVIDLRGVPPGAWLDDTSFAGALIQGMVVSPDERVLTYPWGIMPPNIPFDELRVGGLRIAGRRWTGTAPRLRPIHVHVDAGSVVPAYLAAIRAQPGVITISDGPPVTAYATRTHRLSMGEGIDVEVRVGFRARSNLAFVDSVPGRWIRTAVGCDADRVATGNHLAASRMDARACEVGLPGVHVPAAWADTLPAAGYRMLGAMRMATVAATFTPNAGARARARSAMPGVVAAAERANTSDQYTDALRRIAAIMHSDRAIVTRTDPTRRHPIVAAPFTTQVAEGRLLLGRVLDPVARRLAPLVGAEIIAIDGRGIAEISDSVRRVDAHADPLASQNVVPLLTRWSPEPAHDSLRLSLRTGDGAVRDVSIAYSPPKALDHGERAGRIIRRVARRAVYIDLDRIEPETTDSVFIALDAGDDIILDLRGWIRPEVVAGIAARIRGSSRYARYVGFRSHAMGTADDTVGRDVVTGLFVAPAAPRRGAGRIVALIDARSAYPALMLRGAGVRRFVGSPTEGISTRTQLLSLPGNRSVRLPQAEALGSAAWDPNRVAVAPTITALPTVAGIRAGRDEPLERAVRSLGQRYISEAEGFVAVSRYARRRLNPEPSVLGWTAVDADSGYRIGIDTSGAQAGRGSAHFTAVDATADHASLTQTIAADEFRDTELLISALVRIRAPAFGNSVRVYVRVREDSTSDPITGEMRPARWVGTTMPVVGPIGWQRQDGAFRVSPEASTLTVEIVVVGDGEVWVDDVVIEPHPYPDRMYDELRALRPRSEARAPLPAPTHVPRRLVNQFFERWKS